MKNTQDRKDQPLSYNEGSGINLSIKPAWGQPAPGMATPDHAGYDPRPRDAASQQAAFQSRNPEFQNISHDGDWTSAKWTPNV